MISRRDLYAAGEPFGENATRRKPGGGLVCGLGGDSSSASTAIQNTTNTLIDSRSVSDNRNYSSTVGDISNSGNTNSAWGNTDSFNTTTTTNLTMTDQGAVKAAQGIATAALANNATNTDSMFAVAQKLFSQTKDTTDANLLLAGSLSTGAKQAYSDATSQATGSKTIMLVALAAVVIVVGLAVYKK